MKVFEIIQSKNVNELVDFFNSYNTWEDAPWMYWWDKNYCKKCESVTAYNSFFGHEAEHAWCELHGNRCKYFSNLDEIPDEKMMIKLWLESECEEDV